MLVGFQWLLFGIINDIYFSVKSLVIRNFILLFIAGCDTLNKQSNKSLFNLLLVCAIFGKIFEKFLKKNILREKGKNKSGVGVQNYLVGENSVGAKTRQCISRINGTVYATHSSHPGDRHAASRVSFRSCNDL